MWHVMITLHAVAGVAAFGVGVVILRPGQLRRHPWLLPLLVWLLVALVVFMVGAMAAHWTELDMAAQIVFSGLVGLGGYMLFRAVRARGTTGRVAEGLRLRTIDDVGFLLISLFDGFVIVTALDLGAPPWAVAGLAVAAVVVGHRAIERAKRQVDPRRPAQPADR